jgi:hypothetical protein
MHIKLLPINDDPRRNSMRGRSILSILTCVTLLAATPVNALPRASCALIDSATSANEDFAEFALAKDIKAARAALVVIHRSFAKIRPALPEAAALRAEMHIRAVDAAILAGDLPHAAVEAIEVYRVLIVAFRERLPTTLDVALLDYTGFRLHALLASPSISWRGIETTVEISAENTQSVQKRLDILKRSGLSDLIGDIEKGLKAAAAARNGAWLGSIAQIQLDSVDLLEKAIKNPSDDACS